jgi:hypothetical protein
MKYSGHSINSTFGEEFACELWNNKKAISYGFSLSIKVVCMEKKK